MFPSHDPSGQCIDHGRPKNWQELRDQCKDESIDKWYRAAVAGRRYVQERNCEPVSVSKIHGTKIDRYFGCNLKSWNKFRNINFWDSMPFFLTLTEEYVKDVPLVNYYDHKAGKFQNIKFGKFLTKYFPEMPSDIVKECVEVFSVEHGRPTIMSTQDPDQIEHVYLTGPNSCMSHMGDFVSDIHPCRIYGGYGDISLYWLQRGEKISARVLVNEIKKEYSTIYGVPRHLKKYLRENGYIYGDLTGCRLQKIELPDGEIVLPYIDGERNVSDHGDYLKIVDYSSDYYAETVHGIAGELCMCAHCETPMSPELLSFVEYWTNYGRESVDMCESCMDNLVYSEHQDIYIWREDAHTLYTDYGEDVCLPTYDDCDIYEYEGDFYTFDGLDHHNLVITEDDEIAHIDHVSINESRVVIFR